MFKENMLILKKNFKLMSSCVISDPWGFGVSKKLLSNNCVVIMDGQSVIMPFLLSFPLFLYATSF